MTAPQTISRFQVENMDCASCAAKVDTAVRRVPGVSDVSVSVTAATMTVTHAPDINLRALARTVAALGYPSKLVQAVGDHAGSGHAHQHERSDRPFWSSTKARLTIASAVALAVAYGVGHLRPSIAVSAFLVALAVGLLPIARRAVLAALAGTPFSIEALMTIAALGAVIIGATEEAAVVVLLFLVGELLEGFAASHARAGIQGLTRLVPKIARLERNGELSEVPADSLAIGATVLVRPGDRMPADGVVTEGESAVDEAPVTGESVPKRKAPGDPVFAGTMNGDGVLRVRVTATAEDNTIARVVRLVEEAQESKAPTERFIDRFSRFYTPAVVAVAALTAVLPPLLAGADWSAWIYKALAVLLIGCPCALVISTPAAIAAGLSAGARRGLLMKGGAVLETVGRLTTVAFDKTGTLTRGRPVVTDVLPFGRDAAVVLSLAAALEAGSSHPLALAILARAAEAKVPVPPAGASAAIPGRGVVGRVGGVDVFLGSPAAAAERAPVSPEQAAAIAALTEAGKSVSVLVAHGALAGAIALRDEPREDAVRGLAALRSAGISAIMLTGDNRRTAEAVGAGLGIEVRSELMPEDKQRIVLDLKARGAIVGKVGDGINDAPALAAADVGIAMGGGTDVALETADAAVLHGRVMDIADMVGLSRAVMANIRQNIAIALGLKAVFLVTTLLGVTGLWPAILADTGATVLVTANAMRLLGWRGAA
ncbi:heavy metal translocating P-type ATPase [Chthonobacter albigriseus]|uniref:heavy metal translocating P-type ATPase n=1 Tax=Chthonobacter albigriseus TaxID=1683161 RepID=UPI0015EEE9C1|nr:heavy metal translocating P-type ATPase [Chthonobacter albigriseus]